MILTPFCRFQLGFRTVEFNPSKGRGFLTEGVDRDGQTRGQARERPKGGDGPRATRATGVSNCLHTPRAVEGFPRRNPFVAHRASLPAPCFEPPSRPALTVCDDALGSCSASVRGLFVGCQLSLLTAWNGARRGTHRLFRAETLGRAFQLRGAPEVF